MDEGGREARSGSWRRIAPWLLAAGAAVGGLSLLLARSESLPTGPEPVVWNRATCAECRMSVGDRAYAAQLQTRDGEVLNFDDVGCLFRYRRRNAPAVHAVYFRHVREDRWIPESEAGFIPSGPSPMGFDLGGVDASEAGAMSVAKAQEYLGRSPAAGPEGAHAH